MDLYMFRAGARGGAVVEALRYNRKVSGSIAGSLPTEAVGFFVNGEKSTARNTIGRERTIEHTVHETNK
jgi:hypothetical protein